MKYNYLFTAAIAATLFTACGGPKANESSEAGDAAKADSTAIAYTINPDASTVAWKGSKTTGDEHTGNVKLKSGTLSAKNGALVAGKFVIDMKSITNEDLKADPKAMGDLLGHLASNDFFSVDSFPEAMFEITEAKAMTADAQGNNTEVKGNLTIRGISRQISFPAKVETTDAGITAAGAILFNRLEWNINWKKDQATLTEQAMAAVKDGVTRKEIEIKVNLSGAKS
jgi:polyisoprenoid-binding protein YceI